MQVNSINQSITITNTNQPQQTAKMDLELSDFAASASSSTQVSISAAAKDMSARLTEGTDSTSIGYGPTIGTGHIDVERKYRVDGPVRSVAETLIEKNGKFTFMKMTDAQIAEAKLHDEQMAAREAANNKYASQHMDKLYGQVLVKGDDGKERLFGGVYDSGVSISEHYVHVTEDGFGTSLAETRLKEIAEAVHGRIIYSNFLPDPYAGSSARGAPDEFLPKVSARSAFEIMKEVSENPEMAAAQTLTFTSIEQWHAYAAAQVIPQEAQVTQS